MTTQTSVKSETALAFQAYEAGWFDCMALRSPTAERDRFAGCAAVCDYDGIVGFTERIQSVCRESRSSIGSYDDMVKRVRDACEEAEDCAHIRAQAIVDAAVSRLFHAELRRVLVKHARKSTPIAVDIDEADRPQQFCPSDVVRRAIGSADAVDCVDGETMRAARLVCACTVVAPTNMHMVALVCESLRRLIVALNSNAYSDTTCSYPSCVISPLAWRAVQCASMGASTTAILCPFIDYQLAATISTV